MKKNSSDNFTEYMKKNKSDTYIQTKKLIGDWNNKRNYSIQYRMLKFHPKNGMLVEKPHENVSFKQSKWLNKNISFLIYNTEKK